MLTTYPCVYRHMITSYIHCLIHRLYSFHAAVLWIPSTGCSQIISSWACQRVFWLGMQMTGRSRKDYLYTLIRVSVRFPTMHKTSVLCWTCVCYMKLRHVSHIQRYWTQEATTALVRSVITLKLDYMNTLLYGIPDLFKISRCRVCNVI